ncbi:MAG: hypothetical protein FJW88_08640 [Actinobacteria bacterium]|nr:hypothetical protein [Actinomycetota bacterium]
MGVVAYLDAGSGSMVVGAIAAAGAGVAVAAKVGWRRVTGALSPKRQAASLPAEAETAADDVAKATTRNDDA